MAEIIPWTICESKRIEFDNCTSAGPHFRIGVFTSTATNRLAPAQETALEVNGSRQKSGKKDQNWFLHVDFNFTSKNSNTYFIAKI